jgi:NhaP-type Na+/H+ or K+/H+ antiporter
VKLFHILALLLTASAVFSYINHRFLKLPTVIGIMLVALVFSLGLNLLGPVGILLEHEVQAMLASIDFDETLLHGMLSFLLFAGALHVNLNDLSQQRGIIFVLATVGVVGATFLIGAISWVVFGLIGLDIPFIYWMLKSVDNYQVEVLLTLALVTGGYALAETLHLSAPIAIVVAGLLIGNHGRVLAMSEKTRDHLDTFWELVDEILNAVLFVLIGLEVLALTFIQEYLLAGLLAIPIVLLARFVTVGIPITIMRRFRNFTPKAIQVLTWGGLRGGISVALALSLPAGEIRDPLVAVTYAVVVFSILVQGLTIGPLIRSIKN